MLYVGPGTSGACVAALGQSVGAALPQLRIRRASWRTLRAQASLSSTNLLIVPGGRDVPYTRLLGAEVAARIRRFVAAGGRYLGSCAGAYFAADAIDFAAGSPLAVAGPRPLRLWQGVAQGPVGVSTFAYNDPTGASAQALVCAKSGASFVAFTHGGCRFVPGRPSESLVWARYAADMAPAAVAVRCGRGRALLWGLHPEIDAHVARRLGASADTVAALLAAVQLRQAVWRQSLRWLMA